MSRRLSKKLRAIIEDRAGGRCEGCGERAPLEIHHRKYRSRGGEDVPSNLIALCGWGNHTGCHGTAHSGRKGTDLGWAVNSWDDPKEIPVSYRWRGRVLLTDDGMVQQVGKVVAS